MQSDQSHFLQPKNNNNNIFSGKGGSKGSLLLIINTGYSGIKQQEQLVFSMK